MLNQFVVVGRIVTINKEKIEDKKFATMTIAVPRNYKNAEGEYDTDFIECTLWNNIAQNTLEYCQKGDLVGAKGTIRRLANDNKISLVAEKISFLSSTKGE